MIDDGEPAPQADDICWCGDWRADHENGVGKCKYNQPNDLAHGFAHCHEFRLDEYHTNLLRVRQ